MARIILSNVPSALYRNQIRNIVVRMRNLISLTLLHPLSNMAVFNKTHERFNAVKDKALMSCTSMDNPSSVTIEDSAIRSTRLLMTELVHLKNDANDLMEGTPNDTVTSRQNWLPEISGALDAFYNKYSREIDGDFTLDRDFWSLGECIAESKSSSSQLCERIMNHLLAEVRESAGDSQRIADESPLCGGDDSAACQQLEQQLDLRQDLEDFYRIYLNVPR